MRSRSRCLAFALPLLLWTLGCGRGARIHEPPPPFQDAFPISVAAASNPAEWSTPVNLGPVVNSAANDLAAELSKDGLSLYFASNRPGGAGANDLYVSQRTTVNDPWRAPTNLAMLNSSFGDAGPHLSETPLEAGMG
jgi:hypothetical protein